MHTWIKRTLIAGALATATAGVALAHTDFSCFPAEFDADRPVTLTGTVDFVELTNPHAYIHITVPDVGPDGKAKPGATYNWALMVTTPNGMSKLGLTKQSLVKGLKVTVDGFQSKDALCSKKWRSAKPLEIATCKAAGRTLTFANGCVTFTGDQGYPNARAYANLTPCTPPRPQ